MIRFVFALVLFPLAAVVAEAQDANAAPSSREGEALLLEEVRRIAARVEALRGEAFERPPLAVRVPEDLRQAAAEIRAFSTLPRDRLAARGRAWQDIGLGDTESPRNLLFLLAADLKGVGFDPKGNRLLVTPDCLKPEDFVPTGGEKDPATVLMLTGMRPDEPLVGHLLTHVRQRERSGQDVLEETTDRLLASMAWAEGEANLVGVGYVFAGISVGSDVLPFLKSPGEVLDGVLLPPGLEQLAEVERRLAQFVYFEGFERAAARYRAGGWTELAEEAARRRTTRDLLHPEESPLPDAIFPTPPPPPRDGLRPVDVDSLGEQAIVVLVSTLTEKDSLGLLAGQGWAGDRLYRWEADGASGAASGITEWVTRWTSSDGASARPASDVAADFDYAYGRALEARFAGRSFAAVGEGSRTLVTADRLYRIDRRPSAGSTLAEVRVTVRPLGRSAGSGDEAEPRSPDPSP
jgi:hypothetical protein